MSNKIRFLNPFELFFMGFPFFRAARVFISDDKTRAESKILVGYWRMTSQSVLSFHITND